ncbi:3-isopropylmalate dehydratase small subunit 1-like [Tasmannia lanceolata]|uniref:3-isopropylmalate dehydratase small subunit 1-like n=1 Tax=Tasmannia lanceolata TaxID=3420 RepID=UPI00406483FF
MTMIMAAASSKLTYFSSQKHLFSSSPSPFSHPLHPSNPTSLKFPITTSPITTPLKLSPPSPLTSLAAATASPTTTTITTFHGRCFVLSDNIDTDQIIPAEHLTLIPSNPDDYRKLGSLALIGLPSSYPIRFVEPGHSQTQFSIIIAGANFGCGSSREWAPVCLGASGVRAVVAESYARIFFRNSVSTGAVYPLESEGRLCQECSTGDVITIELAECRLINHTTGKEYGLKPIGDAGPVIESGGIFAYARKTGMIATPSASA